MINPKKSNHINYIMAGSIGITTLAGAVFIQRSKICEMANKIFSAKDLPPTPCSKPIKTCDQPKPELQHITSRPKTPQALPNDTIPLLTSEASCQTLLKTSVELHSETHAFLDSLNSHEGTLDSFVQIQQAQASTFVLVDPPLDSSRVLPCVFVSSTTHDAKKNPGNGNCLFYSLIDALDLNLDHLTLRENIYRHIIANIDVDAAYADYLMADGIEVLGDMFDGIRESMLELEKEMISHRVLKFITVDKNFCLYPLIEKISDFTKPLNEETNHRLIENIKKYFRITGNPHSGKSEQAIQEMQVLKESISQNLPTLFKILKRMKVRWEKLAGLNFSDSASKDAIKKKIIRCMLSDLTRSGSFGGKAALYGLSQHLSCHIQIFAKNPDGFRRTSNFGNPNHPTVNLLLSNNHYEAILPKSLLQTSKESSSSAIERAIKKIQNPDEIAIMILENMKTSQTAAIQDLQNLHKLSGSKKTQIEELIAILGES